MKNQIKFLYLAVFIFIAGHTIAQTTELLQKKIEQIVSDKKALVGVSIIGNNGKDTLSLNGGAHFPMQSVFKFHIALAVLAEIDKGKFSLKQKIQISQKDLLPETWSPIRDKYPTGGTLTIAQILEYTVSQSDNNGCDILLRMIGGPETVETYFKNNHFENIAIKVSEAEMHKAWDIQFQNWTTPISATQLLQAYYTNNQLLSKKSNKFLWKTMKATSTGRMRIRGQLPEKTIVAHKTGSSGANDETGITAAVNDIGIVFLLNGNYFIISVFVTDSKEDEVTNEKIIAEITKAVWDNYDR